MCRHLTRSVFLLNSPPHKRAIRYRLAQRHEKNSYSNTQASSRRFEGVEAYWNTLIGVERQEWSLTQLLHHSKVRQLWQTMLHSPILQLPHFRQLPPETRDKHSSWSSLFASLQNSAMITCMPVPTALVLKNMYTVPHFRSTPSSLLCPFHTSDVVRQISQKQVEGRGKMQACIWGEHAIRNLDNQGIPKNYTLTKMSR